MLLVAGLQVFLPMLTYGQQEETMVGGTGHLYIHDYAKGMVMGLVGLLICFLLCLVYYQYKTYTKMKKSLDLLSQLIDKLPFPLTLKDSSNQYMMVNQSFKDLFTRDDPSFYLHKKADDLFDDLVARIIGDMDTHTHKRGRAQGELVLRCETTKRTLRVNKTRLLDQEGTSYIVSSAYDISQMKAHTLELETKVDCLTRALNEASRQLEKLTILDQLTKIYNRRKLDMDLEDLALYYQRSRLPFSVILVDIDHLKAINDGFGHQAGDRVIQGVAHLMKEHIRQTDSLGRWAGEEFLIICRQTKAEGVITLAEKLRQVVEGHDFNFDDTVTCSFGISHFREGMAVSDLIREADLALCQAQMDGRNLVYDYSQMGETIL